MDPAYQQIIGLGREALPLILRELEAGRVDHWFWALFAITGENPVTPAHEGRLDEMALDWLSWARRTGVAW